ncbi:MAG: hypothetical protein HY897_02595 [Deltaproteobacteria bacterium]|nr:hypothetical protein [Deltaproteobacteria bacterium]
MVPDPPPAWWGLRSLDDVVGGLGFVVQEVVQGQLDPRTANAVTGALNVMISAFRAGEFEARLAALERAIEGGEDG